MAEKKNIWTWMEGIKADRVILMAVILLSLFSILTVFSSTSLSGEVMSGSKTRIDLLLEQFLIIGVGFGLLAFIYFVPPIGVIRFLSQGGFILSLIIIMPVVTKMNAGDKTAAIRAVVINDAWRIVSVKGVQLHVFEFMKVLMIMYIGWAVDAWKGRKFRVTNWFYRNYDHCKWLRPDGFWTPMIYIGLPMIIATICFATGSASSAIFMCAIMFLTAGFGGVKIRQLAIYFAIMVGMFLTGYGLYKAGVDALKGPYQRLETAAGRLSRWREDKSLEEILAEKPTRENAFTRQAAIDENMQEESAKLAINHGKIPRGPGRSTQKYRTSEMFSDYVFSFIVEEYGLLGALAILIIYISILARGSLIARQCKNVFPKTVVAGLSLLITLQAMMHICINVGIGPVTGQTLPMLSDGKSAMIAFYIAFAVLLNISKNVKKQLEREAAAKGTLLPQEETQSENGRQTID